MFLQMMNDKKEDMLLDIYKSCDSDEITAYICRQLRNMYSNKKPPLMKRLMGGGAPVLTSILRFSTWLESRLNLY